MNTKENKWLHIKNYNYIQQLKCLQTLKHICNEVLPQKNQKQITANSKDGNSKHMMVTK